MPSSKNSFSSISQKSNLIDVTMSLTCAAQPVKSKSRFHDDFTRVLDRKFGMQPVLERLLAVPVRAIAEALALSDTQSQDVFAQCLRFALDSPSLPRVCCEVITSSDILRTKIRPRFLHRDIYTEDTLEPTVSIPPAPHVTADVSYFASWIAPTPTRKDQTIFKGSGLCVFDGLRPLHIVHADMHPQCIHGLIITAGFSLACGENKVHVLSVHSPKLIISLLHIVSVALTVAGPGLEPRNAEGWVLEGAVNCVYTAEIAHYSETKWENVTVADVLSDSVDMNKGKHVPPGLLIELTPSGSAQRVHVAVLQPNAVFAWKWCVYPAIQLRISGLATPSAAQHAEVAALFPSCKPETVYMSTVASKSDPFQRCLSAWTHCLVRTMSEKHDTMPPIPAISTLPSPVDIRILTPSSTFMLPVASASDSSAAAPVDDSIHYEGKLTATSNLAYQMDNNAVTTLWHAGLATHVRPEWCTQGCKIIAYNIATVLVDDLLVGFTLTPRSQIAVLAFSSTGNDHPAAASPAATPLPCERYQLQVPSLLHAICLRAGREHLQSSDPDVDALIASVLERPFSRIWDILPCWSPTEVSKLCQMIARSAIFRMLKLRQTLMPSVAIIDDYAAASRLRLSEEQQIALAIRESCQLDVRVSVGGDMISIILPLQHIGNCVAGNWNDAKQELSDHSGALPTVGLQALAASKSMRVVWNSSLAIDVVVPAATTPAMDTGAHTPCADTKVWCRDLVVRLASDAPSALDSNLAIPRQGFYPVAVGHFRVTLLQEALHSPVHAEAHMTVKDCLGSVGFALTATWKEATFTLNGTVHSLVMALSNDGQYEWRLRVGDAGSTGGLVESVTVFLPSRADLPYCLPKHFRIGAELCLVNCTRGQTKGGKVFVKCQSIELCKPACSSALHCAGAEKGNLIEVTKLGRLLHTPMMDCSFRQLQGRPSSIIWCRAAWAGENVSKALVLEASVMGKVPQDVARFSSSMGQFVEYDAARKIPTSFPLVYGRAFHSLGEWRAEGAEKTDSLVTSPAFSRPKCSPLAFRIGLNVAFDDGTAEGQIHLEDVFSENEISALIKAVLRSDMQSSWNAVARTEWGNLAGSIVRLLRINPFAIAYWAIQSAWHGPLERSAHSATTWLPDDQAKEVQIRRFLHMEPRFGRNNELFGPSASPSAASPSHDIGPSGGSISTMFVDNVAASYAFQNFLGRMVNRSIGAAVQLVTVQRFYPKNKGDSDDLESRWRVAACLKDAGPQLSAVFRRAVSSHGGHSKPYFRTTKVDSEMCNGSIETLALPHMHFRCINVASAPSDGSFVMWWDD